VDAPSIATLAVAVFAMAVIAAWAPSVTPLVLWNIAARATLVVVVKNTLILWFVRFIDRVVIGIFTHRV
jgi:hypothetical protein